MTFPQTGVANSGGHTYQLAAHGGLAYLTTIEVLNWLPRVRARE
jgi:hypothetical protein